MLGAVRKKIYKSFSSASFISEIAFYAVFIGIFIL